MLTSNTKVLDLLGGDATNAFYHINGLAVDDGVNGTRLLNNVSSAGGGQHHVHFTNAHLICSDPFRFILPSDTDKIFKVSGGGGRVYVASINVIQGPEYVLDVKNGDIANGFFHINGLTVDAGNTNVTLLENVDAGDGLTHVRFTNMQFAYNSGTAPAKINIDRSSSTSGQTVVEIVGSSHLAIGGTRLTQNVTIKGASASKRSRLVIRDSNMPAFTGTPPVSQLIAPGSSNYTENRLNNWVFNSGLVDDEVQTD